MGKSLTWDRSKGFGAQTEARESKAFDFSPEDTLTACGGIGIKADTKDPFKGSIALVLFTSPSDPDQQGDFFTKAETDYGTHKTSDVYWHHGLDATVLKAKIGACSLREDDTAIWMDYQLDRGNKYAKAIAALPPEKRAMIGASSGTAAHLVTREDIKVKGETVARKITKWPLGLDASLTFTPVEPRTRQDIMPIKSWTVGGESSFKALTEGMQDEANSSSVQTDPKLGDYTYSVNPMVGHAISSKMGTEHMALAGRLLKNRTVSVPEYAHIMDKFSGCLYHFHNGLNEGVANRIMDGYSYEDMGYKAMTGASSQMKTIGDALHAHLTMAYNTGADHLLANGHLNKEEHEAMRGHFTECRDAYIGALQEGVRERDLGSSGSTYLPMNSFAGKTILDMRLSDEVNGVLDASETLKALTVSVTDRFAAVKSTRQGAGSDLGPTACDLIEKTVGSLESSSKSLKALLPDATLTRVKDAVKAARLAIAKATLAASKEN
jgi:hypothetical protein